MSLLRGNVSDYLAKFAQLRYRLAPALPRALHSCYGFRAWYRGAGSIPVESSRAYLGIAHTDSRRSRESRRVQSAPLARSMKTGVILSPRGVSSREPEQTPKSAGYFSFRR